MLNFISTTIAIKMHQNGQVVQQEIEAMVAESVGLAYHPTDAGQEAPRFITITHIASQVRVGGQWEATTEHEAQQWIELLHDIIDWMQPLPSVRPGKYGKVLHLATIGALHEVAEEEQSV